MRALVVEPRTADSARLMDVPEPQGPALLVEMLAVGVCGTDREIVAGDYGEGPPGSPWLILGHESLGRVLEAPDDSGFSAGDLVVGIVRHPDPVPCEACAVGEWDMCRNGRFTEHGIKQLHGFCAERVRLEPEMTVRLDPALEGVGVLLEPASVVAKAWDHVERIGRRAHWSPRRVSVTGAGPVGLLAALMAVQRGYEVRVLDRVMDGPKPELVRALGAEYHVDNVHAACTGADIVLECTGVGALVYEVMACNAPGGIVCLTGISSGHRLLEADMTGLNRSLVLDNDVVFGTVNANRLHYELAAESLAAADRGWLERMISRRVPMTSWPDALHRRADDVKVVIDPKA